jgi:hypothetical protein
MSLPMSWLSQYMVCRVEKTCELYKSVDDMKGAYSHQSQRQRRVGPGGHVTAVAGGHVTAVESDRSLQSRRHSGKGAIDYHVTLKTKLWADGVGCKAILVSSNVSF